jgi:hypothetical protein
MPDNIIYETFEEDNHTTEKTQTKNPQIQPKAMLGN